MHAQHVLQQRMLKLLLGVELSSSKGRAFISDSTTAL